MFAVQSPPRNLLSSRLPRAPVAHSFPDYLSALQKGHWVTQTNGVRPPQYQTAKDLEDSGFTDQLIAQLLTLLPLTTFAPTAPLERVVAQYVSDTARLADQVDAVNKMFSRIVDSQTQMVGSPEVRSRLEKWWVGVVSEQARTHFNAALFTPQSAAVVLEPHIVTADLLATQRSKILSLLQDDLRRRSGLIAAYVHRCLAKGLKSGLLGIVAWKAEDTCWYVRNEQRLAPEGSWSDSRYQRWRTSKEVHLMDAVTLRGVPGWLDLPPAVQHVAESIPPVLLPHLSTVVGTMIRQREFTWLDGTVAFPTEALVAAQRAIDVDPALVFGNIVLTGWELPHHSTPGWWMRLDRWLNRKAESKHGESTGPTVAAH